MMTLFRRLKYLLQQQHHDSDLVQEVEFHRAMEAERLERDGLSPAAPAVREAIKSTYASAIVLRMETVEGMFADRTAARRLQAWLMAAFALAALVLSAVGIYAILHFTVAQRSREFGVRIALGASRRDLFRLVVGQGLRLPAIGLAAGLAGAFVVTRLIEHLLFQVSPTDPMTFCGVGVLLMAVALVASWIPARRATRIDPIASLRCE
jgi:putative ABC transport system permease protein